MTLCLATDNSLGGMIFDCSDFESGMKLILSKLHGHSWVISSRAGDYGRRYDLSILDQSGSVMNRGLITISEGNPENTPDYSTVSEAIGWTSRKPVGGQREITFYLTETEAPSMSWIDLSNYLFLK